MLHYLLRNGSERVVSSAREHIYDMKPLEEYAFRDEQGKDQGINGTASFDCHFNPPTPSLSPHLSFYPPSVRQKAKEIIAFLQDEERLKDARKQAKQTRDKFVGYSSEETQHKYSKTPPSV